jgi:hypothetical protein
MRQRTKFRKSVDGYVLCPSDEAVDGIGWRLADVRSLTCDSLVAPAGGGAAEFAERDGSSADFEVPHDRGDQVWVCPGVIDI